MVLKPPKPLIWSFSTPPRSFKHSSPTGLAKLYLRLQLFKAAKDTRMPSQVTREDGQPTGESQATVSSPVRWTKMVEDQYAKIKENAETYPYVWGSYIIVYGGFGLWMTYRWRRLRKTEDRVRVLQERLQKLVQAESSAKAAPAEKASSGASKQLK